MKSVTALLLPLVAIACREDLRQPLPARLLTPVAAVAVADEAWAGRSGPIKCTILETPVQVRAHVGGGANPPEGELFGQIADVVVAEDGRAYVLDGGEARVQVYDRGGRFVFRFGGKGGGPGELAQPVSLALANGHVYVLDGGRERVEVYSPEGRYLTGWRIDRHLPAQAMGQTLAVRGGEVFVGLHYFLIPGQPTLSAPVYGVLKTDTAGHAPVLLDPLSADRLGRGSFRNIPVPNRFVAADDRYVAVGDVWHRDVRVYTRAGEPVLQFASCLPVDPNAAGLPAGRPANAVGGVAVGSRLTALGHGRFARLTPFIDASRQLRQRVEILDAPRRHAWAVQVPPDGGRWRRYTSVAIGSDVIVFTNSYRAYLEWVSVALPTSDARQVTAMQH